MVINLIPILVYGYTNLIPILAYGYTNLIPILVYGYKSWVMTEKVLFQVQAADLGSLLLTV